MLIQIQIDGEDQRLHQRDVEMQLHVEQRHENRDYEYVEEHHVHGDLARAAGEAGGQQIEDHARSDQASVDDHDGLIDGDDADRRHADAQDGNRTGRLHDGGQEHAATTKARISDSPLPSTRSRNQG